VSLLAILSQGRATAQSSEREKGETKNSSAPLGLCKSFSERIEYCRLFFNLQKRHGLRVIKGFFRIVPELDPILSLMQSSIYAMLEYTL